MLKNNLSAKRIGYIKSYCRDLQRNPEISSTPTYIRTLSPEDQIKAKEQGRENRRSFIEKYARNDPNICPYAYLSLALSDIASHSGILLAGALGGAKLITHMVYLETNIVLPIIEEAGIAFLVTAPLTYILARKFVKIPERNERQKVRDIASNSISLEETGKPASSLEKTVSY